MRIDISIFGETQFSRELTRIGEHAENLDPVFRSVFSHIREINAEQMLTRGSRGGTPWEPLKPATIKAKAARHATHPDWPEFDTEALFRALSHTNDENNEEIFNRTWAVFRVTGEPGEYGPVQSRGSEERGLPARPLFRLTAMDRKEIVDEIAYYIFKGVVRNFVV